MLTATLPVVTIYTDGACLNNPGAGGYGVVLESGGSQRELSGGFRRTTNNRMELLAAIEGLRALKKPSQVKLYSDSQYLVSAMTQGWVEKWQANRWMKDKKTRVPNHDLWKQLLDLCAVHQVEFAWVAGHDGVPLNERCDRLAMQAALRQELPADVEYEREEQLQHPPELF